MSLHIKHFELPQGTVFDLHDLHCLNPARYPHLLQTAALGATGNQYDILFAFPGEKLVLDSSYCLHFDTDQNAVLPEQDFLQALDQWWQKTGTHSGDEQLPFSGGWFVYLGYELAQQIEPSLALPGCDDGLPIAFAIRIPAAVIFDHSSNCIIALAESGHADLLTHLCTDIATVRVNPSKQADKNISVTTFAEDPPERYLHAVEKIIRYIREGDVFQVNLSRQWQAELPSAIDHNQLYRQLRINNPAPFFGLATYVDKAVISSSPERLVRVNADRVETRPIAGTRPRSNIAMTDNASKDELLGHPKERAEHIMLIDLERNDLGRVCKPGSVVVDELMVLESYTHVHHIVSNVCGILRDGVTPGQVLRAVFPGGTITGCPKVRCMEIIAELEQTGRGAYTGSMGYLNHNGNMDFNILIRTMVKAANHIYIRAGAGIVADSVAEKELQETRAKARGLLLSLGVDTIP